MAMNFQELTEIVADEPLFESGLLLARARHQVCDAGFLQRPAAHRTRFHGGGATRSEPGRLSRRLSSRIRASCRMDQDFYEACLDPRDYRPCH